MKRLLLLTFLWAGGLMAQEPVVTETGDFREVKIFSGITAELIASDVNKVVVTGPQAKEVLVNNQSGKLKIRMKINKVFEGDRIEAKIYYKSRLEVLDVNEGGSIESREPLELVDLELRAQEGGEIELKVALERLKVKSVSGGTISVNGTSKMQEVYVNTGGGYEGGNLQSEQTEVQVNAGGYADVRASEIVEASVTAGGNINIYGKPRVIDRSTFLGGTIKEM